MTCRSLGCLVIVLGLLLVNPLISFALDALPGEILANPDRFDGQVVTLQGTITNFRERVSRSGNAYYTFDLSESKLSVCFRSASRTYSTTRSRRRE